MRLTSRPKRARRWTLLVAPFAVTLVFFACQGGLREDELECEQAVSQLSNCCPDFQAQEISCTYDSSGCSTSFPALTVDESQCIASESCATLISTGVCTRAQGSLPIQTTNDGGLTDHAEVCP